MGRNAGGSGGGANDEDLSDRLFNLEDVPSVVRRKASPRVTDLYEEVRRFGGYTAEKLEVLESYLKQYRMVAGSGTYIDGFAGEGSVDVRGVVRPGSPAVALSTKAFKRLHLFEIDSRRRGRLKRYLRYHFPESQTRRCRFHERDFNDEVHEILRAEQIDPGRPCFAFLDPNSTELAWDTVGALSSYKTADPRAEPRRCKIELWILFNLNQAIQRLWTVERDAQGLPRNAHVLDRLMGGRDAWIDLWNEGRRSSSLVTAYALQLQGDLGYESVVPWAIRDPRRGQIAYYMIHATDHPAAEAFMRGATKRGVERTRRDVELPLR